MTSKIVSMIVPVYNAETGLTKCIESILNQTHAQIEVILINDGSTDQSAVICDQYAQADKRVQVFHQKNAGPSEARNRGLELATGDYIQFVDADDYIEPTMTEILVDAMFPDHELVICGYQTSGQKHPEHYVPPIEGIFQQSELLQHIGKLYKSIILPSPCNKLYDRKVITAHNLRFSAAYKLGEDLLFNLDYVNVCEKINVIKNELYHYVTSNEQSLSSTYNQNLLHNQQQLFQAVKNFLITNNCYTGENKQLSHIIYANSMINCLTNLFHPGSDLTKAEQKREIAAIIASQDVQENLDSFSDSAQARLIKRLIESNSVHGVYAFFRMKQLLRTNMQPVFQLVRKLSLSPGLQWRKS